MATKYNDRNTIDFLLNDVHQVEELTNLPYFEDHDSETFSMTLDTAQQIGDSIMFPYLKELDANQPELVDGQVKVHPQIKNYLTAIGDAGIIGADFSYDDGGAQLPLAVSSMVGHTLMAANNGMMYGGLTSGAARLISHFGSQELRDRYVPNMLSGKWQGTMCLTEPQAGSSLSDIETSATPNDNGSYHISGQKIFISAGDHDACENVIHLLIGRIKGAPTGSKGISLFVVPKFLPDGQRNDLTNVSIFHKLGQKGVSTLHLGFGDKSNTCVGYLLGEANKGLAYMFQMMNEARIGVGATGASIASAAYQASLEYAQERPQSRRLNEKEARDTAQVLIIQHPNVRRMLFLQKAVVEGSLSLVTEVAKYYDLSQHSESEEDRNKYYLLLELLTPIVKTYPCEAGVRAIYDAVQVFGGYGFTEDFPVEQYYRDIRITPIYEGTTGIQSLDLLGRKVLMKNGKAMNLLASEMTEIIKAASAFSDLEIYAQKLGSSMQQLSDVTAHLMKIAQTGDVELFLSDASLYMDFMSQIVQGWQWLKIGLSAQRKLTETTEADELKFLKSKLKTMQFFYHYELPKTNGLAERLLDKTVITVLKGDEEMVF